MINRCYFGSFVIALCALVDPAFAQDENPDWYGFVGVRGGLVEGQAGWPEGGFGRLYGGADGVDDTDPWGRLEAQLGLDWTAGTSWRGRLHGLARAEDSDVPGPAVGLTEAWVGYQRAVGNQSELMARGGLMFYPSSQENIDPLWGSPYTLTYSAINSWFAEEFRPIGLDVEWRRFLESGQEWSAAATVFAGNDTLGTLLAWRGWAMHDRLSVVGERLALPPVFSLEADGSFGQNQRLFRTTAFGEDLDDRPGLAFRVRTDKPGRFNAQLAWIDNRGDRALHGQEYAWHTRFWLAGGFFRVTESLEMMVELTRGRTTMNFPGMPWVDADFQAAYWLGSIDTAIGRWSLRHDRFTVSDQLRNLGWGVFDDRGQAWTLAWIHRLGERSRFGAELLWLDSRRTVAAQSGFPADTSGASLTLEWRYLF